MPNTTVCLAGTLDTKGAEYEFVRDRLIDAGVDVLVIDCGVLGTPHFAPDISADEVASAAGIDLADFRAGVEGAGGRVAAVESMGEGLATVLGDLVSSGRIQGVMGLGGSGGTYLLTDAFRTLPLGFPKLMVSTMASGDVRPYVGHSDMHMANAVTDIAGINNVSKLVLSNAAGSIAGMAQGYEATRALATEGEPLIAITMFGVTTPGVMRIREQLESEGFQVVTFHAVGEGAGMEHLIDEGIIDGLIDFTLAELLNTWNDGIFRIDIERMSAATRNSIPLVVVPGAAECFNFAAPETIPEKYNTPERNIILHNPNITSLLATPDEMTRLGEYVADHVNRSLGPKAVALPLQGLDNYFKEGSQWHGVDITPLFEAIRSTLDPSTELVEMDNLINDEPFADAVFGLFMERWKQAHSQ